MLNLELSELPESTISSKFLTQLEEFGIQTKSIHRNLPVEELVEISTQKNEGVLTSSDSLSVKTGKYTGRSPQDRYIIYDDETHETIDWGNVNRQFPSEKFNHIFEKQSCQEIRVSSHRNVCLTTKPPYRVQKSFYR